jgi:SNF2 family DNA or RNA helicase
MMHQKAGIEAQGVKPAFYVCHALGAGKTVTALKNLEELVKKGFVVRTLYIAPLSTLENVRREALRWTQGLRPQVVNGDRKKRTNMLKNPGDRNLDIINFEAVRVVAPELLGARYDMVIVDEGKRIAHFDAQQTRIIKLIGRQARYRRVMGGLPFSESIEDAWSQFDFLDHTLFPGNYYAFRNRYCQLETREVPLRGKDGRVVFVSKGWQCPGCGERHETQSFICKFCGMKSVPGKAPKTRKFSVIKGVKNLDEFEARIAPYIHIVLKKEALPDLPDITPVVHEVDLLEEQRRIYDSVEMDAATHLDEIEIDHKSAMSHMQKCRQVAAGFIYDNERLAHYVPTAKYEVLKEVLEESLYGQEKAVIFTSFRAEPEMVAKKVSEIDGVKVFTVPDEAKERQPTIDEWTKHPGKAVLIANVQSGGVGLNLQAAYLAVFMSNDWRFHDRDQAKGRIHRKGSEIHKKIVVADIVTRNTIEEDILKVVNDKEEIVKLFIERLRRRQEAMGIRKTEKVS